MEGPRGSDLQVCEVAGAQDPAAAASKRESEPTNPGETQVGEPGGPGGYPSQNSLFPSKVAASFNFNKAFQLEDSTAPSLTNELGGFISNDALEDGQSQWQWEHRSGFRDYNEQMNARIEDAYQRGEFHVRLKSGKAGQTPMEIFFVDMLQHDPKSGNVRRVRRIGKIDIWTRLQRRYREFARMIERGSMERVVFSKYEQKRQELFQQIQEFKSSRSNNSLTNAASGHSCEAIAKSTWFFVISNLAVCFYSVWIGIEADHNKELHLNESDLIFRIAEHFFCIFFTAEVSVKIVAKKPKRAILRDHWIVFDLALVVLMVGETWVMPILLLALGMDNAQRPGVRELGVLRLARIVRLTRLGRILKLLRAMPEMLTLLKGIAAAMRSVIFTLMLLMVVVYAFAVFFKTSSENSEDLKELFPTVPKTMWVLLLRGTFLDGPAEIADRILADTWVLAVIFLFFILVSSFTILNMLIGILCDVVAQVGATEKEQAQVSYLRHSLLELLECHDRDNNEELHEGEFELLMRNPEMNWALTRFGVNVADLISLKEVLFIPKVEEDELVCSDQVATNEIQATLSFTEFLEVVLRLRGGNSATVLDIVELREYIKQRLDKFEGVTEEGHLLSPKCSSSPLPPEVNTPPALTAAKIPAVKLPQLPGAVSDEEGQPVLNTSVSEKIQAQVQELKEGQEALMRQQSLSTQKLSEKQDRVENQVQQLQTQLNAIQQMLQVIADSGRMEREESA
eukprot:TRINITY_DN15428_c0_g2_i1.p1 TRINITY_DN15428_c0_g2~~TRINITY_DN15428_c0_g2_i1.p1  ORF type:complete len:738 (+),score=143.35 TRINITY_DN15428_c0_g2_i1:139-2352(+)